ncbi:MAG: MFS transporter [Amylibacter sp.]|jgi:MFS family permease|nr:MFS transporter [Amylibacter sp.]MDG2403268.1 MFS transporter [Amylibacter sp.]
MNLTALRSPSYRRYFIGSAAAVNGLWILRVVITWLAWENSLSATFVGLIAALTMLPTMIIGPFFGAIMDRSNIIKAAYATNFGMILAALIAIILLLLNLMSTFFLIILAIYIGVITAAHHPMRLSIGPRLVQKEQISSVSALAALNFNTARVISPFFGGLLIEYFGTLTALLIAILLYLPNIIIYTTLHPRRLKVSGEHQSISAAIKEGFLFVWASKYLRLIFLISAVYTISIRSVAEILPVIADGTFSNGASGLGHLAATVGAGSLCAAIYKALGTSDRVPAFKVSIIFVTVFGMVSAWILTITQQWSLALISAACMGFAATYLGVSFQAEIQADLHDNIRGRVMSLWGMITLGSMSLGSLLLGLIADKFGLFFAGTSLIICSSICLSYILLKSQSFRE